MQLLYQINIKKSTTLKSVQVFNFTPVFIIVKGFICFYYNNNCHCPANVKLTKAGNKPKPLAPLNL